MQDRFNFDQKELDYLQNQDFLITKRIIIDKIFLMFTHLEKSLVEFIEQQNINIPSGYLSRHGKVSKGENYRQLPYLVLDYPRYFKKNDVFSIRTMFWWGHFFSNTIHLQGKILNELRERIVSNSIILRKYNYYICVHNNPWEYHYRRDNYLPIKELDEIEAENILRRHKFIKISAKTNLEDWQRVEKNTINFINSMIQLIR